MVYDPGPYRVRQERLVPKRDQARPTPMHLIDMYRLKEGIPKKYKVSNRERILEKESGEINQNQNKSHSQHKDIEPKLPIVVTENKNICSDYSKYACKKINPFRTFWHRVMRNKATTITALATVAIAILTFFYTRYSGRQWDTMKNQAVIMQGQLSTAKVTLEDARKSAVEQNDRAERLTKANERIANRAENLAKTNNRIAQASFQSISTAKQVAKQSLDATIDNFRREQRAWVGIKISHPEYVNGDNKVYIEEGKPFDPILYIVNSGKTPAREFIGLADMYYLHPGKPTEPRINWAFLTPNRPGGLVLQPGGEAHIKPNIPSDLNIFKIDKDAIEEIKSSRRRVYITADIFYKDVFTDKFHCTQFCVYLLPDFTGFTACSINIGKNAVDEEVGYCK